MRSPHLDACEEIAMTLSAFRCKGLAPLAGAAALLAGCAVGPDFVAPPDRKSVV